MAFVEEFTTRDWVLMGLAVVVGGVGVYYIIRKVKPLIVRIKMSVQAKFDAIVPVDIDASGRFKYVLIKVYSGEGEDFKYIVRGYTWAEWHADVYEQAFDRVKGLGFETECVGGGRILHEPDKKTITVFGYSQGYGRADHSITVDLLKKHYPDYTNITFNNDGY